MKSSKELLDAPIAAPSDQLRARAVGGVAVTGISQTIKMVVQFLSVVVLARLLSPDDFGVFAMVMPITAFVMMFQDLGLAQAVVTSASITPRQASTLFWVNVGLSAVLAIALAASAPLIGAFYGEPRAVGMAVALAATVMIAGLGAQHMALLTRHMRFSRMAMIDIAGTILGFATAVVFALIRPSPWALFASVAVTMATSMIGAWLSADWRPGRPGPIREVGAMLRFGGGLTGFNLTNFLARNIDKVLIGRTAGADALGLYDRAYKLLLWPLQQINAPLSRVMVPVLSRLRDEPGRYRHAYERTVRLILLAALPGVTFLILTADKLIATLMGDEWAAAAPIFMWLGLAGLHQPMTSTVGWLFISQQRTGEFARWGMINAVTSIAAFAAGLPWGAIGVAAAYALSDLFLRMPIVWWWVGRKGPVRTRALYVMAAPFAAGAAAAAALLAVARRFSTGIAIVDLMLLAAIAYVGAWTVVLAFKGGRAAFADAFGVVRPLIDKLAGRLRREPARP
ncbi:lipopolysaccharide biosynthesis protein [Caulobacter segnis]|uniref:lipopolysaccharide biosynthesis protein n=1 Tax=Caulobacter segnis TaxID=88688 RepID=UPI00240F0163|nr:lipopolysaccharide biosynthesis protein [Caulobacter segnis]MDG2520308.1 lipopolysaccharide biosynthesis protein [Caulobacter segnis]